ncbi:Neurofilament medium polypeptide [Paramuricea clavata]|uniref:Neurofilament medium polypeptide n=1 Tax=Paramuricea clavata TaxID=317549 RepID=A0A7D9HKB0_PARCT|nr:Neurofilament medium polypeptide [Paramuricea clavata]
MWSSDSSDGDSVNQVSALTNGQLRQMLDDIKPTLIGIMEGTVKSAKHDWFLSRRNRKDMTFNCGMGRFVTWQHEFISSYLMKRLVKKQISSAVDYIILVMFPEALARIYMAVNDVSFDKASKALFKKNVKEDLEEEPKVIHFSPRKAILVKGSGRGTKPTVEVIEVEDDEVPQDEEVPGEKPVNTSEDADEEDEDFELPPEEEEEEQEGEADIQDEEGNDDDHSETMFPKPLKNKRRLKPCPICGRSFKVLLSHLKVKHKLGAQEAKRLSGQKRLVQLGTTQKTPPVPCPQPGCRNVVVRVDRHLVRVHGMEKTDTEYIRMNNEAKAKRHSAASKKAAKLLKRKSPMKMDDLPLKGEAEDTEVSLSSSEEEDEEEEEQEMDEISAPKIIQRNSINGKVDNIPALSQFYKYLYSMDGGARPVKASKENKRRVGRLLFEITSRMEDVRLLWDDCSLRKLRSTFFEGNHLLPEKQRRQPHTLRAYITALRLFYDFVVAMRVRLGKTCNVIISQDDLENIQSARQLTAGWLKSLASSVSIRKQELHKQDLDQHISSEDFARIANQPTNKKLESDMLALSKRQLTFISRDRFAEFRDNLMLKLLCRSAQRPGALANLTVEEFKNGIWDREQEPPLFITETQIHKTSSTEGSAAIFWNGTNYELGQVYLKKLMPLIQNPVLSVLPHITGVAKERHAFFVNYSGKFMTGRQITRRIRDVTKKTCPDLAVKFHGSRIRKHIVTEHRESMTPDVSAADLASQMSHNVKTASAYYHVDEIVKKKARVGRYLEQKLKLFGDQPSASTAWEKDEDSTTTHSQTKKHKPNPKGRKVFNSIQSKVVEEATLQLKDNASKGEILQVLGKDKSAKEHGLISGGHFSDQQLRDKFRSLRRNK